MGKMLPVARDFMHPASVTRTSDAQCDTGCRSKLSACNSPGHFARLEEQAVREKILAAHVTLFPKRAQARRTWTRSQRPSWPPRTQTSAC